MNQTGIRFSKKSQRTPESPISYFMEQALRNPHLISLAAGMVDSGSLPVEHISATVSELLADPKVARAALQYGTTQGHRKLRENLLTHLHNLDGVDPRQNHVSVEEVVVTTGSQQLLYLLSELLLDAEDIVITEAPSYFVYHSVLQGTGVEIRTVPMDEEGMIVETLDELLKSLDESGDLRRVKLIYTVDYFQNPTGLTLSSERRKAFMEVVQRFSAKQRLLVLEDAAYRELRYDGEDLPSLKSMDANNQNIIYSGTFSKPCSPGLKTGYAMLPADLVEPLIRLKGNHDFGSSNLAQYILNHVWETGRYHTHVAHLRDVYRLKRDAMLDALQTEFGEISGAEWTSPHGGMFVWLTLPEGTLTGTGTPLLRAAIDEGVLYIPGEFGHIEIDGKKPRNEMRLSFGDATIPMIHEGIRRLRVAFDKSNLARIEKRGLVSSAI
jgi:2-aminoadipate transaminase